jgi:predicted adenine nucleotide alpha hydrolase (AANH) superfamily ATPase
MNKVKKVLLHICCGVCAFYPIDKLRNEGFYVEGLFYNPNIHPEEEYVRRKDAIEKLGQIVSVKISEGDYEFGKWLRLCQALKDEKEGGRRCYLCYELRLERTAALAKEKGFEYFTTTLTVSPHKNSKTIIELGNKLGKNAFLAIDFKKEDGFKKTMEFAKKYSLYHQNYCGCIYSIKSSK